MTDRPTDMEIVEYINDLQMALAKSNVPCLTETRLHNAVHPWVCELLNPGHWISVAGPDPLDDLADGPSDL